VYVEPAASDDPAVRAAGAAGVPVHPVPEGALKKVLDLVTPQAVVAVARAVVATLDSVVAAASAAGAPLLVLVELQDPGNAGTLVRVAEAAGCAGVVLTERSVDLYNPKSVRATAGSLFRVPVVQDVTVDAVLAACAAAGVPTLATVAVDGTDPESSPLDAAVAVLLGSEAHGLAAELVARADARVTIPMVGKVESLNAGVAGAVLAFEAARRRRDKDAE
jgi:TrmH family RNA methyltransferase